MGHGDGPFAFSRPWETVFVRPGICGNARCQLLEVTVLALEHLAHEHLSLCLSLSLFILDGGAKKPTTGNLGRNLHEQLLDTHSIPTVRCNPRPEKRHVLSFQHVVLMHELGSVYKCGDDAWSDVL